MLFWLAVWQLAAMIINKRIILVTPVDAARRLCSLAVTADFWRTAFNSFLNIGGGFTAGLISGIALGALSERFGAAKAIISPAMTAVKSVPVASIIILALFWMKSTHLSVFVSFLMVLPVIYGSVCQGISSADKKLREAADIFKIRGFSRIRFLYLPAVMPFLPAACKTAAGLAFKSGTAAEVIGQPDFTLGDMLFRAKIYLETADLFAWTAVIIILGKLFEALVCAILRLCYKKALMLKGSVYSA